MLRVTGCSLSPHGSLWVYIFNSTGVNEWMAARRRVLCYRKRDLVGATKKGTAKKGTTLGQSKGVSEM